MPRIACLFAVCFGAAALTMAAAEPAPVPVSVCDLTANPQRFQGKRVEVSGIVNHEFEDFSLSDAKYPGAPDAPGIWLEYGGTRSSQVVFCCPGSGGAQRRTQPLTIDGVETAFQEDKTFRRFEQLLRREPSSKTRAAFIGRFFAARTNPDASVSGYGHFGLNHLFVIERVVKAGKP